MADRQDSSVRLVFPLLTCLVLTCPILNPKRFL
jgi:hypothetical protein